MIGGDAVVAEAAHPRGEVAVIRRDEAAFARRDVLDGVQTEATEIAEGADLLILIRAADGMAGIGDEREFMFGGDGPQLLVVARLSGVIHGDDGLGAWGDFAFHRGRVKEQRVF